MTSKGTPSNKYPFRTPEKMKKRSYEIRLAAQFGDCKAKRKLDAYNRMRKERMLEAGNKDWIIDGKPRNRYWVMEMVVTRVSDGEALTEICKGEGYPSMRQIYSWKRCHPDFARALAEAEEVRGHILGEMALTIALATDRENVAADKLKIEVLSKFAARSNQSFQDKQVNQNIDEFATLTTEQIRQRIKALVASNPDLQTLGYDPSVPQTDQPTLACEIVDPPTEEPDSHGEDD